MAAPLRLRLSCAGGAAGRGVARGGGVSDGANGSGGGCGCGSSTGGGGVERGGSGGGRRRGRAGRGSCLGVSAFAAAPPSARTHAVASPFLRRRPAGGTIGSARTRGDAAALPAGGRPEGAARAAARRLAGGDWAVPRVWSPLSPTLPPSLPPPLPLLRTGRLRMGALDALKGAPRWMLSQPEPSPVLDTHRVLGTPIHSDAHYRAAGFEIAYFGGGCFWSLERTFWGTRGVVTTAVGYQGGDSDVVNPSYRAVCAGEAAFAEVVKVVYDPAVLSYEAAVDVWLAAHDPTTANRQGGDTGVQYRSAVFCEGERHRALAEERLAHFGTLLSERRAAAAAAAAAAATAAATAAAAATEIAMAPADASAGGSLAADPAVAAVTTRATDGSTPLPSRRRTRPPGGVEGDAVVTVVDDAADNPFYYAELYHQQYLSENPWATCASNANSVYVPPRLGEAGTPDV